MPTADEKTVLRIVEEGGGQSSIAAVARQMGLRIDYARVICESLGRRDYIDVLASGKLDLTSKGWKALGKERAGAFREDYR